MDRTAPRPGSPETHPTIDLAMTGRVAGRRVAGSDRHVRTLDGRRMRR
jgi:hypothetical protein